MMHIAHLCNLPGTDGVVAVVCGAPKNNVEKTYHNMIHFASTVNCEWFDKYKYLNSF